MIAATIRITKTPIPIQLQVDKNAVIVVAPFALQPLHYLEPLILLNVTDVCAIASIISVEADNCQDRLIGLFYEENLLGRTMSVTTKCLYLGLILSIHL